MMTDGLAFRILLALGAAAGIYALYQFADAGKEIPWYAF